MHSPTIFRCLEIIMITSLLPRDVRPCAGTGRHLLMKWTLDMITQHWHTASHWAIVSAHYYYNNPILSPHSTLSLVTWHAMGGSVPSPGVPPGHHQWSPMSALGHQCHTSANTGDEKQTEICFLAPSGAQGMQIIASFWLELSFLAHLSFSSLSILRRTDGA